jgi:prepilin-type N-terminal cleavage/methylation domain-containing protein
VYAASREAVRSTAGEGPARSAVARSFGRGFTLIELLVCIIIIGLLAVMAIPSMSLASYERDTYNDAGNIMQVFRSARTRAIARGSAVVVQMVTNGNYTRGGFFTYEAVSANPGGVAGSQMPIATCKYPTQWPVGSLTAIDGFALNPAANSVESLAGIMAQPYAYTAAVTAKTAFTEGYVCYTPLGRMYVAIGAAPPVFKGLSPVTALEIQVTRTDGATIRSVLLPNNGMARIFSHTQ